MANANAAEFKQDAFLMASHFPCYPTAGIEENHDIGIDGEPREPRCGMVVDGTAYLQAFEAWKAGDMTASEPPSPESFGACVCIGEVPVVPAECKPEDKVCGIYPNDQSRLPTTYEQLTPARIKDFCTPYDPKVSSNFVGHLHDPQQERLLWTQLCGVVPGK